MIKNGAAPAVHNEEKISTPHTAKHQPAVGSENQPLVLVVETDKQIRYFVGQFLEKAGYVVNFADDGYSALDSVRAKPPALVITDILIPRLNGLSLCRLLKGDLQTSVVPILVYSELDSEALAREAGANAFTKKPIEKIRLLDLVRSLSSSTSGQEDA